MAALTTDCLCGDYEQPILFALSVSFMMTLLAVTDICINHYLIKEPVTHNPLKLIFQVLRYAVKNKYPRLRSAFTYWEDKPYSRIDLGKSKYGGPFTTEQVEDVKTFFRFLALLSSHSLGSSNRWTRICLYMSHYQDGLFIKSNDNCLTLKDFGNCIQQKIVKHVSIFTVVLFAHSRRTVKYQMLQSKQIP